MSLCLAKGLRPLRSTHGLRAFCIRITSTKHGWRWVERPNTCAKRQGLGYTLCTRRPSPRSDRVATGRREPAVLDTAQQQHVSVPNLTDPVSSHDFKHQVALGGDVHPQDQLEVKVVTSPPAVSLIGYCS